MAEVMDSLDRAFLEVCRAFNRKGVRYVVIGGMAIIIHGFPRTTVDIDFFIDPATENVIKVKAALKEVFGDSSIDEISPEDIKNYSVVRYGTEGGFYIDLIGNLGTQFSFEDVIRDIMIYEVERVEIPVCGAKTLLEMKQTIRHKDKMDIEFLKEKLSQED